ncbi:MAG: hypothetical protein GXO85_15420 [Chlorobi bacterium]|nr:hypothetical protein [Chlorobiota bacterium]
MRTIESYEINGASDIASHDAIQGFHAKLKLFRQRVRGVKDKNFFFNRIIQYYA